MRFPRYWAKSNLNPASSRGGPLPVSCWRWSDASMEDAQRKADSRATELNQKLQSGAQLNHYDYGDGAIREEVVQTIAPSAVVTRNVYGALVLNATNAMFID